MKAVSFAALAASAMFACSSTRTPEAATATRIGVTRTTGAEIVDQTRLQDRLREAFLDRATWSHAFVVASLSWAPDRDVTRDRLFRAQAEIGELYAPFHGERSGEELTRLLRREASDLSAAASAAASGDAAGVERARRAMHLDASRVATFLASQNPALSQRGLGIGLRSEVEDAIGEIRARAAGDYGAAENDADSVDGQALALGDILAGAIVEQFPGEVGPAQLDARAQSTHVVVRDAFYARGALLHVYAVEARGPSAATRSAELRMMRNAGAIARPFAFFYGDAAGAELAQLLRAETRDAIAAVDAIEAGASEPTGVRRAWDDDADRVAAFVARANPRVDRSTLAREMHACISAAIDAARARAERNWTASVRAADELRFRSVRGGDMLSGAIVSQFQL